MNTAHNAFIGLTLAALCACGGGENEPPPPDPPLDGALMLGSAAATGSGFVDITDGDEVELVPGAQGGFHIWTTLRVKGTSGELFLAREARQVSDGTLVLLALDQYIDVPSDAMTDWWERDEATPSFMCPAPIGVRIFDTELALTAQLKTADGTIVAEDHVVVTPVCPTGDSEAFCLRVCDG